MAKQLIDDSIWDEEIPAAERYYKEWADLFKCDVLEKYYEGFQWGEGRDNQGLYVINKFYETMQIKLDSFIPNYPKFVIKPRGGNADWDLELASASSALKEDVLNTIIDNDEEHFIDETKLAYKESFTRFSVMEVGYSADWILNPNAPKALLNVDKDQQAKGQKPKRIKAPEEVPISERIYVKHIGAKRFRVGGLDNKYLSRCTWYGYYETVDKNDLLALPGLMNRSKVEELGSAQPTPNAVVSDRDRQEKGRNPYGQGIKIWHIWHTKTKQRLVVVDSPKITIFQRGYQRDGIIDYRPDMRAVTEGFYPIPPSFHWISPQDEINETREQLRKHRRRFVRKYQINGEMIDDEEVEKFESGVDGQIVKTKGTAAIEPIQNADLGSAINAAIGTSNQDINEISGSSANSRGVSDRTTATESEYINQRATIRETAERDRISRFFGRIGREILLTARDRWVLGIWAQRTSDSKQDLFEEMKENEQALQWVTSEDLKDGFDFRITVDLTTMSAAAREGEKKNYLEFLAIVTQYPQVAMSPTLIRQTAYVTGFRNEKIIKEMQKMALLHQLGMMNQIGQQPGGLPQQQLAAGTPNSIEQQRQKVKGQIAQ